MTVLPSIAASRQRPWRSAGIAGVASLRQALLLQRERGAALRDAGEIGLGRFRLAARIIGAGEQLERADVGAGHIGQRPQRLDRADIVADDRLRGAERAPTDDIAGLSAEQSGQRIDRRIGVAGAIGDDPWISITAGTSSSTPWVRCIIIAASGQLPTRAAITA